MAYTACMQYTLRNVPRSVDHALRTRAQHERRSLNDVAIEALERGLGLTGQAVKQRDLGDVAGSWRADRATDDALAEQRGIDVTLWR